MGRVVGWLEIGLKCQRKLHKLVKIPKLSLWICFQVPTKVIYVALEGEGKDPEKMSKLFSRSLIYTLKCTTIECGWFLEFYILAPYISGGILRSCKNIRSLALS